MLYGSEKLARVDLRLVSFAHLLGASASFDVEVTSGLRTDAAQQAAYFSAGTSKAATLSETPHGRGGAIDIVPRISGRPTWDGVDHLFDQIGQLAIKNGLVWGGTWKSFRDLPHVEVPDWRTLPMPSSVLVAQSSNSAEGNGTGKALLGLLAFVGASLWA